MSQDINDDFDDIDFGADICELCMGTGRIESENTLDGLPHTCPDCFGTGVYEDAEVGCDECGGTGLSSDTSDYRCPGCGGTG